MGGALLVKYMLLSIRGLDVKLSIRGLDVKLSINDTA